MSVIPCRHVQHRGISYSLSIINASMVMISSELFNSLKIMSGSSTLPKQQIGFAFLKGDFTCTFVFVIMTLSYFFTSFLTNESAM